MPSPSKAAKASRAARASKASTAAAPAKKEGNAAERVHTRARGTGPVDWKPRYFAALATTAGNVTLAAAAAGISRKSVYEWRNEDAGFAAQELKAMKRGAMALHEEAIRRAVQGVMRLKFQPKTGKVFAEREYSDVLLLRLLEHSETGSFRQKQQIEHSAPGVFATRAERKAALAAARAEIAATSGRPLSPPSENESLPMTTTETEPKK